MSNPNRVIVIKKKHTNSFSENYNTSAPQRQQYNNTYSGSYQDNSSNDSNNDYTSSSSSSSSSYGNGRRGSMNSGKLPSAVVKRKAIPRAKLTQEMLQGKSGVDRIIQEFKAMHFNKECDWRVQEENLHQLMHKYETWGRQLVPQLSFEQFISSLEKIASKREFRSRVEGVEVGLSFNIDRQVQEEVDAGKRMRSLEDEQQQAQQAQNSNNNGNEDYVVIDTYEAVVQEPPQKRVLTEEDRKRIEMNKQKARERRMAKELERQRAQQQQRQQHDDFDQDIEIQLQIEQELEQERQRNQQQQQESNQDSQQTQIDSQQTQIDSQQTQIDSQQ